MRKLLLVLLTVFLTITISFSPRGARAKIAYVPNHSTALELIDAVNALRAAHGLSSYSPNTILISTAQKQAEYNLTIGTITHISSDGLRPFQRALLAGYPVAGDLNLGGWFSENIVAGVGLSASGAVEMWTGDDPHLNTMISPNLQDIGAGVAVSGNTYYYVIDCGRSTGGTPRLFTPPPSYNPPIPTIIPNTPNSDGSITYIVQRGDTTLAIALAYGISLSDLLTLNGLAAMSVIYPNQKLIIRTAYTPTSTFPTSTPTRISTITPWPTATQTPTLTSVPPTSTPSPALPVPVARRAIAIIVVGAMLIAAFFAFLGPKRK